MAKRESDARASVESIRREERRNVYWANLHLAQKAWHGNRLDHMRQHLQQVVPVSSSDEDLRGFEWNYLWRLSDPPSLILEDHFQEAKVTFSPDGRHLASPNERGEVRIFDTATGEKLFHLPGHLQCAAKLRRRDSPGHRQVQSSSSADRSTVRQNPEGRCPPIRETP